MPQDMLLTSVVEDNVRSNVQRRTHARWRRMRQSFPRYSFTWSLLGSGSALVSLFGGGVATSSRRGAVRPTAKATAADKAAPSMRAAMAEDVTLHELAAEEEHVTQHASHRALRRRSRDGVVEEAARGNVTGWRRGCLRGAG